MQCFQGKSVYKGIAMGPVVVLKKNDYQVKRTRIEDAETEAARVDVALKASQEQLQKLYDKAVKEVGEASAAIFEVHQMMLEDEDYLEAIQNMIRTEQVNAEYAVAVTGDNFAEMFASMDDDYMKARSADIKDISERLVRNLSGQGDVDFSSIEPSVIVADDLSPSECFNDVYLKLKEKKGIYILESNNYRWASGHATLWYNGNAIGKHNYWDHAKSIHFWELK